MPKPTAPKPRTDTRNPDPGPTRPIALGEGKLRKASERHEQEEQVWQRFGEALVAAGKEWRRKRGGEGGTGLLTLEELLDLAVILLKAELQGRLGEEMSQLGWQEVVAAFDRIAESLYPRCGPAAGSV